MGLAFVPLYIKYLGIEAYGLIGLFALLQAWLSLLDMGMTPTLSREMARFTGDCHTAESIRDLLRTIEIIALAIALLITIGVALGSDWVASSWLQTESLPVEVVMQAFAIMGLITALRFIAGVYRSTIIGLQRQVLFNVVNSILATIRSVGAIAILAWVSPTIQAFFLWQALLSIVTLVILAIVAYASLPRIDRMGRFSMDMLRNTWKFAGGMMCINFLALILMQVDKILLSKLLSLSAFGYYTLAAAVAGVLYILIAPITQAIYPKLCELHSREDEIGIAEVYHKGAQLVSVVAGSAAIVMILFAKSFLHLWTQDHDLAAHTAPLLSLLMFGNLLNGLVHMPYQAQLSYGWTSLSVKVNIIAVLVLVPSIIWVTPRYGAEGAAWAWVILNTGYVIIAVHFVFRRILSTEKWEWYINDLILPLGAGIAVAVALKISGIGRDGIFSQLTLLTLAFLITGATSLLCAGRLRRQLQKTIIRYCNLYRTNVGN